MTPDKIKEAFSNWWATYASSEEFRNNRDTRVDLKAAWQACAEWILSQASEKDNEVFNKEIAEWSEKFKQVFSNNNGEFLGHTALHFFKRGLSLARLSSAKEIREKDERIKALEGELLKAFPMIKFLHDYTERFPFATKLVSKKEEK
jgi:5-methylthioribose kinase